MSGLSALLNSHRSIRKFKATPISEALIRQVCGDAIAGASSSANLNSFTLVLTQDPDRKEALYRLHSEQPMVLEAPLLITFCADWHRTREWLRLREARDKFNNFLSYNVAAFDAMIVAQNVCLGFEAEGLGICYMGTTLNSMSSISELLELPETWVSVTTIVVGYPDEDPPKRDRLPLDAFLHQERYRPSSRSEIEDTYRLREKRGWDRYMSIPELKALVEEHGITSLAQFYTSKAKYDPDYFAEVSAKLSEHLVLKKLFSDSP